MKRATRRKRDLTAQEGIFLKQRRAQQWIVDCQVTPPGYEGPKRAISYLARYVAGVAISDQRLVSDSGGNIIISYKDYKNREKTGKKFSTLCLSVAEFMLRFMLHILPRHMARVRHSGLFKAGGRDERLAKCLQLILAAKQTKIGIESGGSDSEADSLREKTRDFVTTGAAEDQRTNDEANIDQQATEENAVAGEEDDEPPKVLISTDSLSIFCGEDRALRHWISFARQAP